ncbi:MAG: ABC transporter permease [Candidatus Hodarchaeales archaeon]|jgi:peptide/nickel transport system permease protein
MASETDYLGEEIHEDVFSFRVSLKARWKEMKYAIALLRKSPLFIIGFFVIFFLVALAVFAPVIASYGPREFDINIMNEAPLTTDMRTSLRWTGFSSMTNLFDLEPDMKARTWVADFTNNSFDDFVIGTAEPSLLFYENQGTVGDNLNWVHIEDYFNISLPAGIERVVPTAGDLDGDNDNDLIIGGGDGHLYVSFNNGVPETPVWSDFSILRNSNDQIFNFTGQANPTLIDYDNDTENLIDLIVSSDIDANTGRYQIYTYMNMGNRTHPSFGVKTYLWAGRPVAYGPKNITGKILEINPTSQTSGSMRIYFAVINSDDRPDMILIWDSGRYLYYTSSNLVRDPTFFLLNKAEASVTFDFPTLKEEPYLDFRWTDFTGDNASDIVIFANNGSAIYNFQFYEVDGRFHLLGTDEQGGDIWSRIVWALRTDFFLAVWVVSVAAVVGTIIGGLAGYFGGWVDNLMMRITDIFFAFPGLILAMSIAAALGPNLFNLSIAMIIVWWSGYARISRGQVISEKNRLYVEAARSVGMSDMRILFRHILPNSIYPLLVAATLDLGGVVLTAAGLSFIGFGAQPGDAELGIMIASGRQYFLSAPWLVFFPGIFIFLIVLAFNLVGDGVRDVMDPKLRR